jgi:sugar lactone lactonase YvrE
MKLKLALSAVIAFIAFNYSYAQPATTASKVYGQTSLTSGGRATTATGLSLPLAAVADSSGSLYVVDCLNNRVVVYPAGSTTANVVFGQAGSFITGTSNNGGVSANSLSLPSDVAVDATGNVYICDQSNNRVLYYPIGATSATRVYGQGSSGTNFTTNASGVSATAMNGPSGVALDSSGNLYVADYYNNRVLFFPSGSVTATRVYGQGSTGTSLTTNTADTGATYMSHPYRVVLDSSGNLYVSENGNNRVVYFASGSVTATRVYGQPNFTTSSIATSVSATTLANPDGLALDSSGNLYVADEGNNRVLYFPSGSVTATRVYGASNLTTAGSFSTTATGFIAENSVSLDSLGNMYVGDSGNNRVLYFPAPAPALTSPASAFVLVNTSFSYTITASVTATSFTATGLPAGLTLNTATGVITGTPTATGLYTVSLTATTSAGVSTGTLSLAVVTNSFSDNFATDTTINTSYWSVDANSNLIGGTVKLVDGQLESINRGHIVSKANYPGVLEIDSTILMHVISAPPGKTQFASFAWKTNGTDSGIYYGPTAGLMLNIDQAGTVSLQNIADGNSSSVTLSAFNLDTPISVVITDTGSLASVYLNGATTPTLTLSYTSSNMGGGCLDFFSRENLNGNNKVTGVEGYVAFRNLTVKTFPLSQVTSSLSLTGTVGAAFNYQIVANNTPTAYAISALPAGLTLNATTGVISGTPTSVSSGSANLTVTNASGTAIQVINYSITAQPVPVISSASAISGTVGTALNYQITASNSPTSFNASGLPPGLTLNSITGVISGTPTAATVTPVTLTATNAGGSGTQVLTITINSAIVPVAIVTQPVTQSVILGSPVTLSVSTTGTTPTYQWYLNGNLIPGATAASYTLSVAAIQNGGTYTVVATNSAGSVTSSAAVLTVTVPGRLINLSVLSLDGPGSQLLTLGFVNGGSGTTGSQSLLIRGSGPTLPSFGVANVLPDPVITVFQGSNTVVTNDNWGSTPANVTAIMTADTATGAFAFASTSSLDAAVVQSLPSVAGGYTVQVTDKNSATGNTLAEVYDYTPNYTVTSPRLINLSCRQFVAANGILTAGFVIGGSTSVKVLVRASGPTLTGYGVQGVMPDPKVTVFDNTGKVLSTNSGWAGSAAITAANSATGAFQFSSSTSKDSAVVLTLAPGSYTAQAASATGTAGVSLVEVYEVPSTN